MTNHNSLPNHSFILADSRERPSGIPARLQELGIKVRVTTLRTGDYLVHDEIAIERKTADDFIQSLTAGRLFEQCARLAKTGLRTLLLLEGDPFATNHHIDDQAIKGALLSLSVSWQIPVVYSTDAEDSARQLYMVSKQAKQHTPYLRYKGVKPKRLRTQQIQFLQGLPHTGAITAGKLFKHFGSIEAVIHADVDALQAVEGIGKKMASRIRTFLSEQPGT